MAKLEYPVGLSVKYDGVPVRIDVAPDEGGFRWATQSRSGEPLPSTHTVVAAFLEAAVAGGYEFTSPVTFVAEVTHTEFTEFKDISGVVRRKEPQDNLVLNFFDFTNHCDAPWFLRQRMLRQIMRAGGSDTARYVHQHLCRAEFEVDSALCNARKMPDADKVEGYILRSANALWKPGTRHWDYQKVVEDPAVDLRIVGFEEARNAHGIPLGMVGRVLADYKGTVIGIGPGKLTHAERIELWAGYGGAHCHDKTYSAGIATIKYKRDDSYTALRQPTFQHWRTDKTEPSYE